MAEYIEREAAVKAFNNFDAGRADSPPFTLLTPEEFAEYLYELPAADVAPVVRCKECEHAERYERTDGTVGYYCGHPQNTFTYGERWDRAFKPVKEADDFCSYGTNKFGCGARMDGADG